MAIKEDWWSESSCSIFLMKYNSVTDLYEIIDTVVDVEYITGGVPTNGYFFKTEGRHEVEFTLKGNDIIDTLMYVPSLTSVVILNHVTKI